MKSKFLYVGIFASLFLGFRLTAFALYTVKTLGSMLEKMEIDLDDEVDIKETL